MRSCWCEIFCESISVCVLERSKPPEAECARAKLMILDWVARCSSVPTEGGCVLRKKGRLNAEPPYDIIYTVCFQTAEARVHAI